MKKEMAWGFALSAFLGAADAQDCDCTNYPFKPNPPCFNQCVTKLTGKRPEEVGKVKNLDPGVQLGIEVLSRSKDPATIDFRSIRGKEDLDRAALKSLGAAGSTPR